jgi:hypothetical protein
LNNIVEQDHRAIKRRTRPMLGFKNFRCARILLSGIELAHMIAKGQMKDNCIERSHAEQFYSLASYVILIIARMIRFPPYRDRSTFYHCPPSLCAPTSPRGVTQT